MCAGLYFKGDREHGLGYKVYFPIPYVEIPVLSKGGVKERIYWGRRNKKEFPETNFLTIVSDKKIMKQPGIF